jgi:hypothetical protein
MGKLPPDVLEFLKKQGRKGGKAAAETMTPEGRSERARKAAAKSAEVRSKKAAAKRKARKASEPPH